jgi:hypothetical protein
MLYFDVPASHELPAEVAELADALASGASGRKAIGVRVPASAPTNRAVTHNLLSTSWRETQKLVLFQLAIDEAREVREY